MLLGRLRQTWLWAASFDCQYCWNSSSFAREAPGIDLRRFPTFVEPSCCCAQSMIHREYSSCERSNGHAGIPEFLRRSLAKLTLCLPGETSWSDKSSASAIAGRGWCGANNPWGEMSIPVTDSSDCRPASNHADASDPIHSARMQKRAHQMS